MIFNFKKVINTWASSLMYFSCDSFKINFRSAWVLTVDNYIISSLQVPSYPARPFDQSMFAEARGRKLFVTVLYLTYNNIPTIKEVMGQHNLVYNYKLCKIGKIKCLCPTLFTILQSDRPQTEMVVSPQLCTCCCFDCFLLRQSEGKRFLNSRAGSRPAEKLTSSPPP